MEIVFAFGRAGLEVRLPGGYQYSVIEARSAMPLPDVECGTGSSNRLPCSCRDGEGTEECGHCRL